MKELKKYDFTPDPDHEADPEVVDDVMSVMTGRKSMKELESEAESVLDAGIEVSTIREANEAANKLAPHERLIVNVPTDYIDECQMEIMSHLIQYGMGKSQVSVERATMPITDHYGNVVSLQDMPQIWTIYKGLVQNYRLTTDCIRPYLSKLSPAAVGDSGAKAMIEELAKVGIRG